VTVEADEPLVPFFVHSLAFHLGLAEQRKGAPLTEEEVLRVRDGALCVMVTAEQARAMIEARRRIDPGYRHVDPENCWAEWQQLRLERQQAPG
jgi:hypothetical protein